MGKVDVEALNDKYLSGYSALDSALKIKLSVTELQQIWSCMVRPTIDTLTAELLKQQVPRWVPVSERLPNEGQAVLYSGHVCIGPFLGRYEDSTFYGRAGFLHVSDVTHWMPLPPEPQGVGGE